MAGKRFFWFIFVSTFVLAFLVTIQAYPSNDLEDANDRYSVKVRESKIKGKKWRLENAVITDEKEIEALENLYAEPNSWNHKHVQAQSRRKRLLQEGSYPWEPIADDGTMEEAVVERYTGRSRRNVTTLKTPKRGHKKLKMALAQAGSKTLPDKTISTSSNGVESFADRKEKKVNRRHATLGRFRSKRYTVGRAHADNRADYYAQRRAVMERFYARQREISEKYARKTTPSPPKYIHTYDVTEDNSSRNVSSNDTKAENAVDASNNHNNHNPTVTTEATSTTEAYKQTTAVADQQNASNKAQAAYNSLEDNNEENGSDDYDYYVLDENKAKANVEESDTVHEDDSQVFEEIKDHLNWGICNGLLVYQHNVIITVHNGARADADITTSLQTPFCVTCIRVTPAGKYNATASLIVGNRWYDDVPTSARIKVNSFQDQTLVYAVKVWAVPKLKHECD